MAVTTPPGIRNVVGQLAEILTVTMISRICIDIRKAGELRDVLCCGSNISIGPMSSIRFAEVEDIEMETIAGGLTVEAGGG